MSSGWFDLSTYCLFVCLFFINDGIFSSVTTVMVAWTCRFCEGTCKRLLLTLSRVDLVLKNIQLYICSQSTAKQHARKFIYISLPKLHVDSLLPGKTGNGGVSRSSIVKNCVITVQELCRHLQVLYSHVCYSLPHRLMWYVKSLCRS